MLQYDKYPKFYDTRNTTANSQNPHTITAVLSPKKKKKKQYFDPSTKITSPPTNIQTTSRIGYILGGQMDKIMCH
jgi:hypothetical protein